MLPDSPPPIIPNTASTVSARPPRNGKLLLGVVVVLGALVVVLGVVAAMGFSASSRSKAILDTANKQAYSKGQIDQKKADDERYQLSIQSPYRSYVAPTIFGGFEIKFPKNWNAYVVESEEGSQQVNMTLNPDFVKLVSGRDNSYALRVILQRTSFDQLTRQRADDVKKGKLKLSSITVSGIASSRYEGKFDGKHDTGSTVLVPVRDKTVIISTDDKKFVSEFNQVLAQAKIAP